MGINKQKKEVWNDFWRLFLTFFGGLVYRTYFSIAATRKLTFQSLTTVFFSQLEAIEEQKKVNERMKNETNKRESKQQSSGSPHHCSFSPWSCLLVDFDMLPSLRSCPGHRHMLTRVNNSLPSHFPFDYELKKCDQKLGKSKDGARKIWCILIEQFDYHSIKRVVVPNQ